MAAMRALLAKKPLLRSDITSLELDILLMRLDMKRCLLADAGPMLGDRYESGARKVS